MNDIFCMFWLGKGIEVNFSRFILEVTEKGNSLSKGEIRRYLIGLNYDVHYCHHAYEKKKKWYFIFYNDLLNHLQRLQDHTRGPGYNKYAVYHIIG